MDEQEFRSTYHAVNGLRCVFEKSILSRRSQCSRCTRFHLADREGAACSSPAAQNRCLDLLIRLREKAIFALRITHIEGELPHAKEIRVQTGGLLGLQRALTPDTTPDTIEDIDALISAVLLRHGDLESLPYPEIMQAVVRFEGRPRRKRRD
ncbi:MAG TPA: hypothetical protein VLA26_01945 [Gammaproteobacteria bacterium]|nr:hypothetical protein [Gammaproteobacteria bacterium]